MLLLITCALICTGCTKHQAPSPSPSGPKKQRVEISVWLTSSKSPPSSDPLSITLSTAELPKTPRLIRRGDIVLAVIGLPEQLAMPDAEQFLRRVIDETHPSADAIIVLGRACLEDLQSVVTKNLQYWWKLALVVGTQCNGRALSPVGVTALVERGRTTPVRITFARSMHAILKVE